MAAPSLEEEITCSAASDPADSLALALAAAWASARLALCKGCRSPVEEVACADDEGLATRLILPFVEGSLSVFSSFFSVGRGSSFFSDEEEVGVGEGVGLGSSFLVEEDDEEGATHSLEEDGGGGGGGVQVEVGVTLTSSFFVEEGFFSGSGSGVHSSCLEEVDLEDEGSGLGSGFSSSLSPSSSLLLLPPPTGFPFVSQI